MTEIIVCGIVALAALALALWAVTRCLTVEGRMRDAFAELRAEYEKRYDRLLDRQMARSLPEYVKATTYAERVKMRHERGLAAIEQREDAGELVEPPVERRDIVGQDSMP